MYSHSPLWHYLWIAPRIFQIAIAVVMIRRKLYREFPFFFAYTLWEAFLGVSEFTLDHMSSVTPLQYWQVVWFGMFVSTTLRFALIWEIFSHVFEPYPALQELGKMVIRWAGALLIIVAAAVAVYSPTPQGPWVLSGLFVADRTISIIQCGLVLFLFVFSSYFGLSWRSYVFGIATGIGLYATEQLIASSIWMQSGPYSPTDVFSFVTMATFHCCVLIWLFYLLSPEPARRSLEEMPHNDLEVWDRELGRLLHG